MLLSVDTQYGIASDATLLFQEGKIWDIHHIRGLVLETHYIPLRIRYRLHRIISLILRRLNIIDFSI